MSKDRYVAKADAAKSSETQHGLIDVSDGVRIECLRLACTRAADPVGILNLASTFEVFVRQGHAQSFVELERVRADKP